MKLPSTLYRYRSLAGDGFKHTQDIFLRKRLYLPVYSTLNDPAEGFFRNPGKLEYKDGGWYAAHNPLQRLSENVRVLCFTEDCLNPLMWAHYADSHRGICIGFRTAAFQRVRPIQYPSRVPDLDPALPPDEKRTKAFFTKRAAWAYEREWRVVETEETDFLPLKDGDITQVIFGERTSRADREWVFEWLRLSQSKAVMKRIVVSGVHARLHAVMYSEVDDREV